jgi:ATP-dependent helicase HrpA
VTVSVPIYALNQVNDERCEWLVPGMLKDKVLALVKSLHQRPRSRLMPLAEFADQFVAESDAANAFGQGSLVDALLKAVRDKTQLDVKRGDFKLEQVSPHLFMNFRIVDEHGRQLGMGPQPGGAEGRAGRAGEVGVSGIGGAEGGQGDGAACAGGSAQRQGRGAAAQRCGNAIAQATPTGPSASCPS